MTKVSNAFAHPFYCTPFFFCPFFSDSGVCFFVVVRRTSKWIVRWRRLAHPITITINIRSSEVICLGLSLTRQTIHLLELQIITPPRIYCSRSLMPIHTSLPPPILGRQSFAKQQFVCSNGQRRHWAQRNVLYAYAYVREQEREIGSGCRSTLHYSPLNGEW